MFVSSNLLKDLLPYFKRKLAKSYDEKEIESIFFLTCFYQFNLSRIQVLTEERRLSESELLLFRDIVERLTHHEPIQYILGKTEFYGLTFNVSPAVLIPRPETEELVDLVIKEFRDKKNLTILDIGAGSGCIAISIKKNIAASNVFAIDISADAIAVAEKNAEENKTGITFIKADILTNDLSDLTQLDFIISNPPYIPDSDKPAMQANVLDHEPHVALFVSNNDPLIFYKRILELGMVKLKSGGKLFFEIHPQFSSEIILHLNQAGYHSSEIVKDLSGADRFIIASK